MLFMVVALAVTAVAACDETCAARQRAADAWDEYVAETKAKAPQGLQADCVPRRYKASGTYKGTAVLYHGFSACPQQWFTMAKILQGRGFDVLLPLNPGSGNNYLNVKISNYTCLLGCAGPIDDITNMPTEVSGYVEFIARINGIVASAPAPRVVAGLSLGGALALASASSGTTASLYQRALIMNPILKLAKLTEDWLVVNANKNVTEREYYVGWGSGCRTERDYLGRAGVCTFKIANGATAREFGLDSLNAIAPWVTRSSAWIIYDQDDPVIKNQAVRQLAWRYNISKTATCVMNFTDHSMLSIVDDYGMDKWWLPELTCDAVAYLAEGTPLRKSDEVSPTEGKQPYCYLKCTSQTCSFPDRSKVFTC